MKCRIIVPFIASLAFCASAAMAQNAPTPPPAPVAKHMGHGPWHMNKEDMAEHHAQMCSDLYARSVGGLAYIEIKLALTGKQKPLFDRWKRVKLASVRARADECAHRVGRHDGVTQGRLVLPAQGLDQEQGLSVNGGVLPRAEDPAHDLRQSHLLYFFSMPTILASRPSCRPPSNLVPKEVPPA